MSRNYKGENNPNWQGGLIEITCLYCGKKRKISKYLKATAKYCSLVCHGKYQAIKRVGVNATNWKGGVTYQPYPNAFTTKLKESIRKRDNYTCMICKLQPQNTLSVHHIDYDKKNCKSDNLISLCNKCHNVTNGNRVYWTKIFQEMIERIYYFEEVTV
jgi:5-methylcytosine-specific restriction endonuclease McrA